ncbi:MAG: sulfate ABC transporter permease subunit CysT [bacterium]
MSFRAKEFSVLPGFNLTMGYTLLYLGLIVLLPMAALTLKSAGAGWTGFFQTLTHPRVMASFKLTFGTALLAALVNVVMGTVVAWFLIRVKFPGKRFIDALVDLPFAMPTAVSGIALTALYAPNSFLGGLLLKLGIKVAFTPIGITVAMIFIGLPFVIRTIQPALVDLGRDLEEASLTLGASRRQTFWRVILPLLTPSLLTGFTLSFARAVGEYGSVVFIAGNMPMKTEIASLLILTKLEQYDYTGATVIAVGMLLISLVLILIINALQNWSSKHLAT